MNRIDAELPEALTAVSLPILVQNLCAQDARLALVYERFGPPPLWGRDPGFGTLLHIILEQQVSLASAKAAFDKLNGLIGPPTPARFLALDDVTLKQVGFSRQKSRYGRLLAQSLQSGELDLDVLPTLPDAEVKQRLTQLKGIGPWTADIYLLMVLRRPDSWPAGDLALAVAAQELLGLDERPSIPELAQIGEQWRPYRAVAARLLWHYYLSRTK